MNHIKFKKFFSIFLVSIIVLSIGYLKIISAEKNLKTIENDLYDENIISDAINRYLIGDKNLNIVKDENGNDRIIVNDKITITNIGTTFNDSNLKANSLKIATRGGNVSYNGTITKPAIRLSSGVYAPKDIPAKINFSISGSFSYEISGNFGITYGLFQEELGSSIRKVYTEKTTAEYTLRKNKLGIIYGIRIYDEYKYNGWFRKGRLLSPSHFNMFLVER